MQIVRLAADNLLRDFGKWPARAVEIIYGIYTLVAFAIWIVPTWLLVLLAPSRSIAERITTKGLRFFFLAIGCRIRIEGSEHLKTPPPRIFVSNHISYFDVLPLMAALGSEYHFVAKSEVGSMPLIGTFLRKLGHFAFDRSDPRSRVRQAVQIENALDAGESVFVFPEGTFTAHDGVRAFHMGAFRAAASAKSPIIPIALKGTRSFLRDGTCLPRPQTVTIKIGQPLTPEEISTEETWQEAVRLRDVIRAAISAAAGEPLI